MVLDETSAQLHRELRQSVQAALATRRPLLHHLNADTSWLLQIPRPESAVRNGARFYYNILIDPWLQGGQSDLAGWFSQQWHATPSAVGSIAELEELAREIEVLASGLRSGTGRKSYNAGDEDGGKADTFIDAVTVSHEFTDHCHKDTLHEIGRDVPVFATKEAAKLISSWKHFRTVITVDCFGTDGDTDWRSTSMPPLPDWLGISRLLQRDDVLNYHSALMIAFNNKHGNVQAKVANMNGHTAGKRKRHHDTIEPDEDDEAAEAIVYTPHGIESGDLKLIPGASPPINTLAFLHGLHNIRVGTASGRTALQSNLGAHNGLKAQRILNAKYWIGTHDEVKKGGGLVAWFLQRDVVTLKDAVEQERKAKKRKDHDAVNGEFGAVLDSFEDTHWIDLGNGESRVLT
ncbi:hypothetical protein LTR36_006197 [Oleoguttula mirabilis]|uniref:Uncharacterized protein n=1 Tax=Oleoguttula mirabilis TaxID=1507867 RepID=A0AAV9JC78_9PEZI|nr:hypothetical protein LTR36_006197 [Oleoguttula mirabilis]